MCLFQQTKKKHYLLLFLQFESSSTYILTRVGKSSLFFPSSHITAQYKPLARPLGCNGCHDNDVIVVQVLSRISARVSHLYYLNSHDSCDATRSKIVREDVRGANKKGRLVPGMSMKLVPFCNQDHSSSGRRYLIQSVYLFIHLIIYQPIIDDN